MVPDPSSDTPFDRVLRRRRRDRAARTGHDASFLHRRAAEELLQRLALVNRRFATGLVLGCPDEWLCERLRERGMKVVAADPGGEFARRAGGLQCDEDFLPFADGSFDVVLALCTLDSVNDLPGGLTLIRRALKADGLLLAAFAGAGSLPRLRNALRAAEEAEERPASPRIHPQIDVRAAGDLLQRTGFALPVVDCDTVNVRYSDLVRLVEDLRAMAATNVLSQRDQRAFGRLGKAAASTEFAAGSDSDGKTGERFETLHLTGWAPSPDQPKPAPRGSGTASLADALRKKD